MTAELQKFTVQTSCGKELTLYAYDDEHAARQVNTLLWEYDKNELVVDVQPYNKLTALDIFQCGKAHGAYSVDEMDQANHEILPTTIPETGEVRNGRLQELSDMIERLLKAGEVDPYLFMGAIEEFLVRRNALRADECSYWREYYVNTEKEML